MGKSELLVTIAGLQDNDPRLEAVSDALEGKPEPERQVSVRLLRMAEAARETGLSRCTIWRAIKEGRIKTVEIRRGSHRIPLSELQRLCGG